MRFVRYAVGRKLGEGYGFHRVSDGCKLPFQTVYNLDKLHTLNIRYGQQDEDYPVIELLTDPGDPNRWIICQNRKVDFRVGAGGSRSSVSGYGFAQYFFPAFEPGETPDTSCAMRAPAMIAQRYGWMSVEQWQRVSEEPDFAYPPLELDLSEKPAAGGAIGLNEARFALHVWKNVWAFRSKDAGRFTPVDVLVTPAARVERTLDEGLDFLANRLNHILPAPVKALITVAVGVPSQAAQTFNQSVLRVVYDDDYARNEAGCFDFTGSQLILPPTFTISRTEETLAQDMTRGEWPEFYTRLTERVHDNRILGDYNLLLLARRIADDALNPTKNADGVQAQFERIMEYRTRLKQYGLDDDLINDITADMERRLINVAAGAHWPGDDTQVTAVVVRCIRSSPEDPLWQRYMDLLLQRPASAYDMQLLLNGLYQVPDYGGYPQDHIRFFDSFCVLADRLCREGQYPDHAALHGMSGLLFKYAQNPTGDVRAYERYRESLAQLLTGTVRANGEVGKEVFGYLERYRFPSELLGGIEDAAVDFISDFDWIGRENERKTLSAVRALDDAAATGRLADAVSKRVADVASRPVKARTLVDFLDYMEEDKNPVREGDIEALLKACNEPLEQETFSRVQRCFHTPDTFYEAGRAHLQQTPNPDVAELLAWADAESRLSVPDNAVALRMQESLAQPDFSCPRASFEKVIRYLRARLGERAADDAVLAWYESRGVNEDLARPIVHNAIRLARGSRVSGGARLDKLYQDCLWQAFSTELGWCEDWAAMNALPSRERWASMIAFDKAWNYATQSGALQESEVDAWFERCMNREIERARPDSDRSLEGAKALKAQLSAPDIAYPKLKSAFESRLKARIRDALFSRSFEETLSNGDVEACKGLYLKLKDYRDTLLDGKAVESVEAYINASRWINSLLDAPTKEMIINMDLPYPRAAERIVPHSRKLLEMLTKAARDSHEDKYIDDHPAVYLAALQLARMPVARQNREVDWDCYRTLVGVETQADEVSLIAYTHHLLDRYGRKNIDVYDSFMRYVEKREREGLKQPLPERMTGAASMSAWLKDDRIRR